VLIFTRLMEKVRGIDRWPEAKATVVGSSQQEGGYHQGPPRASLNFWYRDSSGERQGGYLTADCQTSLYESDAGDTFTIRYDPKDPTRYYCAEAKSIHTEFVLAFGFLFGFAVVAIAVIMLVRR
jgi:hypothetical protein